MHITRTSLARSRGRATAPKLAAGLLALTLLAACGGGSSGGGSPAPVPPVVTTAPVAVSVAAGQTATFSVVASGTGPLSYQWQSGGANIAGATGASYTTPATMTQMSGQTYDVVVSNAAGQQVTSAPVALTVTAAVSSACASVPAAPGGLVASGATATSVVVDWAAVTPPANCTISGYNVYIGTQSGFTPAAGNLLVAGLATPDYTSSGLAASTTYYYIVEAIDTQGASAASTQLVATTLAAAGTGSGAAPHHRHRADEPGRDHRHHGDVLRRGRRHRPVLVPVAQERRGDRGAPRRRATTRRRRRRPTTARSSAWWCPTPRARRRRRPTRC